jgi:type VI secretion system secreted protein VgrG
MTTPDFTFSFEGADTSAGPWDHLQVVRFRGHEELSALYRYEITLFAKTLAPEVDPYDLVGRRATLRIATLTFPEYKVVHGVIVEAEEVSSVPDGMFYEVVLMPPLVRARHRTRCRIFLEKTTRQIIDAVLQGDPDLTREGGATAPKDTGSAKSFSPAVEKFTWRLADPSRVDGAAVRPYCVQYNESDLAFVARLLEEEGISYHVENGDGVCLLVFSDTDAGKARLDPFDGVGIGGDGEARVVSSVKLGARLREKKVRLHDYDWRKPALSLRAEARADPDDLFEVRYPGGFSYDAPQQGDPLARACLDRYQTEAEYALAQGRCRVLSAGNVFRLEHPASRYDGEYLITKLEAVGEQHGVSATLAAGSSDVPYTTSFECARRGKGVTVAESRYRPPRATHRPRIVGSQTAFVTAEPSTRGNEIHVGGPPGAEIGCVRLKFHWDTDEERLAKEPSSCWVRVSQTVAGMGEGGVWHPRVGVEVIVDHLDGDPDRPLVTGRVYNGRNRPSAPSAGAPTISGFKSFTTPGGGKFNELSFDDAAGSEQISLHAAKDWNSEIGHDRSEHVTNNSASSVDVDRSESTGGNRSTAVKGNNTEGVDGDESIAVKSNQTVAVSVNQSTSVGADQRLTVAANRAVSVGANQKASVGADDSLAVGANRSISVGESRSESVGGNASQSVGGNMSIGVSGNAEETVGGNRSITVGGTLAHAVAAAVTLNGATSITEVAGADFAVAAGVNAGVQAGANLNLIAAAQAVLQGASVHVNASGEIVLAGGGSAIKISGAGVEITGGAIKIAGGTVDVTGGIVNIN